MTWRAEIRAREASLFYVHHEEADRVGDLLGIIRSGYDFESADSVTITFARNAPASREKEQG